jgi:competence protein ComEA
VRRLLDGDPAGGAADSSAAAGSRYRLDPGRRGAAAVAVVVAAAGVVTAVWVFSARPTTMPVTSTSASVATPQPAAAASTSGVRAAPATGSALPIGSAPTASTPTATPPTASSPAARATRVSTTSRVVVDVSGKVRHPGVYRLPSGARVDDAIRAAGGALPSVDLVSINLAARLSDGEQVVVGVALRKGSSSFVAGVQPPATAAAPSPLPSRTARVNLNTASLTQFETLPGIGPALGQRILDWRAAHGRFTSIDQLNDVSGIGDVRMSQLRPLVTI